MAPITTPTSEELERLPWLLADDLILDHDVAPPCQRPGQPGEWWADQHMYCTGGAHIAPGAVVICACACHPDEAVFIKPMPIREASR